jgi:hypothetical protein
MKRNRKPAPPAPYVPRYNTCILHNPAGTYSLVGSVPSALCDTRPDGSLHFRIWPTEGEAKAALLSIGCPFFQLADCSWYPYRPTTDADRRAVSDFWSK